MNSLPPIFDFLSRNIKFYPIIYSFYPIIPKFCLVILIYMLYFWLFHVIIFIFLSHNFNCLSHIYDFTQEKNGIKCIFSFLFFKWQKWASILGIRFFSHLYRPKSSSHSPHRTWAGSVGPLLSIWNSCFPSWIPQQERTCSPNCHILSSTVYSLGSGVFTTDFTFKWQVKGVHLNPTTRPPLLDPSSREQSPLLPSAAFLL